MSDLLQKRKLANAPVAGNLKRIIEERMLTQSKLARKAGLTPKNLSDIVCGYKLIRASEILSLAEALGVGVEELFEEHDSEEKYII